MSEKCSNIPDFFVFKKQKCQKTDSKISDDSKDVSIPMSEKNSEF